jgi:sporulation protein YlmC with PRC-barrel domain
MTMVKTSPVLSASTITGDTVQNREGETLGSIKELMIDTATGRIAYAVLDFGGFLGIHNKLFAVPWTALTVSCEQKCLVLDADKELLKKAEGFDQADWPDFADQRWGARIHHHFRTAPYWE